MYVVNKRETYILCEVVCLESSSVRKYLLISDRPITLYTHYLSNRSVILIASEGFIQTKEDKKIEAHYKVFQNPKKNLTIPNKLINEFEKFYLKGFKFKDMRVYLKVYKNSKQPVVNNNQPTGYLICKKI